MINKIVDVVQVYKNVLESRMGSFEVLSYPTSNTFLGLTKLYSIRPNEASQTVAISFFLANIVVVLLSCWATTQKIFWVVLKNSTFHERFVYIAPKKYNENSMAFGSQTIDSVTGTQTDSGTGNSDLRQELLPWISLQYY